MKMKFIASTILLTIPAARTSDSSCVADADCEAFNTECTRGFCLSGVCEQQAINVNGICDDQNGCTASSFCDAHGTCVSGPESCAHLVTNPCLVGICDATKECLLSAPLVGTQCDDNNSCTVGDQCNALGVCEGTRTECCSDIECSHLDTQCTEGRCDVAGICFETPKIGHSCDDGNACSLGDVCNASGECVASEIKDCSYCDSQCSVGKCDKAGNCFDETFADGTDCDE